jgi:alpha-amylase/alpha-mannosidase (GH57 family)
MAEPRYVCIHGHFYQPPRENPWLEAVEVQDSAAPDHDWNERITRECYAPNTRSRIMDGEGRIVHLLNNYAWMSFNFGPTLLSWMEEHAPNVLRGIVEADRVSRERYGGHGNALAQVYNHVIMPLASPRDKVTQVRWGVADFQHRFGRDPEGMWLAETAADTPTLEVLAEAGIRFTVLSPAQAKQWRRLGAETWEELPGGIDPSRAYLCRLPSGRTINLFFYDGNISRQVAFERLLNRGEEFLSRLMNGFDERRGHPQLMHIATDGESYGHHHPFGDMALAYVLDQFSRHPEVKLTNYGEFLERYPPEWEVEIHEQSAWSCAHGVERWRSNCGCRMRGDWHQEWRAPLRQALDRLKERLDTLFAALGRQCFADPWAVRDAYIEVILDRKEETVRAFFTQHGYPDLDDSLIRDGLRLLEMQRHGMLMFTSCGWFFDEVSGLETTQCLRYAGRALQLARQFGRDFEEEFVGLLEKAPSNIPFFNSGRGVWEQLIRPWQVDLDRVVAHYAISLIYRPYQAHDHVYCYEMEALDQEVVARGSNHVAIGRLRIRSQLTWDHAETDFALIHYGGLDFFTVLRDAASAADYEGFKKQFLDAYRKDSLADVTALVTSEFKGEVHRLDDLFKEEQRRVIGIVLHDRFEDYQRAFERLANQDEDLLNRLGRLGYPVPKPFFSAASAYLDHHLRESLGELENGGSLAPLRALVERGRAWGYQPERELLARTVIEALQRLLQQTGPDSDLHALIERAGLVLDAAGLLGLSLNLWRVQNHLLEAYARLENESALTPSVRDAMVQLADKLNINHSLLGWRP